jgi:hypothetical protein
VGGREMAEKLFEMGVEEGHCAKVEEGISHFLGL